ncbi:efflux transporter outer membrane subunit [Pseudomonas gingeri]|uniref:Efflux transporter outer membrane subunit n=1 Tax=Pseudomonas gingeri TaxID=117681 RepID=A0A7Y7XGU3_9PSED|nr:efflux transporter outer membrane subunit [Pseudomonas gingeri]NWB99644.1 efflux transporter outer membrane subunit [Pseudomonas gingeri]
MSTNAPLSKSIQSRLCYGAVLLLALGVAGCSLAPTYVRPSLPVPKTQSTSVMGEGFEGAFTSGEIHLSQDEERLIAELSPEGMLRTLVQRSLRFNRDFRVTALRVEEAAALYRSASADRMPTVAGRFEHDGQRYESAATNERYGQDLTSISIGISDFELDFFGRVLNLSDAARHDYLATTYGQRAARGALIAEVARLYLLERLAVAQQEGARLINDAEQALLGRVEERQVEGAASFDDVAFQYAQAQEASLKLAAATAEHDRSFQALRLVTGYVQPLPPMRGQFVEALPAELDTPVWLVDMPSERLLERFDVRQSEERLKAANANIGAARAAFFPSIKLSTGMGMASNGLSSLFDGSHGAWLFSPQLSLPLFDGGRNRANLNLAKVRQQIFVAQYEKTIQIAFREMADALDRMQSQRVLRALAQSKAQRVSTELEAGATDRTFLLAAQIRVAQTDIAWQQARQALLLNRLLLYRVLCGVDATPSQQLSSYESSQ